MDLLDLCEVQNLLEDKRNGKEAVTVTNLIDWLIAYNFLTSEAELDELAENGHLYFHTDGVIRIDLELEPVRDDLYQLKTYKFEQGDIEP